MPYREFITNMGKDIMNTISDDGTEACDENNMKIWLKDSFFRSSSTYDFGPSKKLDRLDIFPRSQNQRKIWVIS